MLSLHHCRAHIVIVRNSSFKEFFKNWIAWISHSSFGKYNKNDESLPRITCPQKMLQKMDKQKKRGEHETTRKRLKCKPKGPLLISCKRKNYNFYKGQVFNTNDNQNLVSCGWKNTKRTGDHFTLMAHSENPSLQSEKMEVTFKDLGINDNLCTGLQEMGLERPTEIQMLAIPRLMQGENVVIAAETGSGKTLSYMLPCVEWILKKQQMQARDKEQHRHASPSTVILTPNRELTTQVMRVAESLVPHAQFSPQCAFSGHNTLRLHSQDGRSPIDMLVTTPGSLKGLIQKRVVRGNQLQHIIIDESDTMLDNSFIADIQDIFSEIKIIPAEETEEDSSYLFGTQIALVSATMPRNIEESLSTILHIESLTKITTGALHQLQPHVPQKFIRIKPDSKPEKLVTLVSKSLEKRQPTIVFVKSSKTCYFVTLMLKEMGLPCLRLSGDMPREKRHGVFERFVDGYEDILVATDIASRGLDTTHVTHVINYDFPQDMSDYIHRVGRVGRVGSKQAGHVTSLVSHKWDVDLLWKIEIAARKMRSLSDVDANIKHKLDVLKSHKDTFELNIV